MSINYQSAMMKADANRSKARASSPVTLRHGGSAYSLVFNNAPDRQAFDLTLDGEVVVRLAAFTVAKARRDALSWLDN